MESSVDLVELELKLTPYMNVVDVYEAASDIGKELEHLAEKYGNDAIDKLVPKICSILEQLEQTAGRAEREEVRIRKLQQAQQEIIMLRQDRKQMRERHEIELEQIEIDSRAEISQLSEAVERLTRENSKLCYALENSPLQEQKSLKATVEAIDENNSQMTRLHETLSTRSTLSSGMLKAKEELRQKERDLEEALLQLDDSKAQNSRLQKSMKDQKKRYRNLHSQAQKLMEEKNDLTGQLRESTLKVIALEHQLTEQAKTKATPPVSKPAVTNSPEKKKKAASQTEDDGNTAKFTSNELRSILTERNQLKSKVMELQDQLDEIKRKSSSSITSTEDEDQEESESAQEEPAVQGPINREPYEKLYGKSPKGSAIRNLFRGLFGENSVLKDGIFNSLRDGNLSHLSD